MTPADPLPADVLAALARGQTIEAIKLLRAATGLGLKEAKDAIDLHLDGRPPRPSVASMLSLPFAVSSAVKQGRKIEAIRLLREQGGLGLKEAKDAVEAVEREQATGTDDRSPGEVPRSRGVFWLVAIGLLAALALFARQLFERPG